jgi:uncharacterized membrane protein YidH (DUF202 family)
MPTDRGLAAERTSLAWRRTGLSLFVCGIVIMRGIPTRDGVPGRPLLGAVILVLAAVPFAISSRQAAVRAKEMGTDRPTARMADVAPLAVGIALVGVAGFVVALLS